MLANVYVGDFYNDGHGQYETVTLDINKTPSEWQEAFREIEERSGFNFRRFVCGDYQEHFIPKSTVERLEAMGVSFHHLGEYEEGEISKEDVVIMTDKFREALEDHRSNTVTHGSETSTSTLTWIVESSLEALETTTKV